jgi:hypothetical protein
MAVGDFISVTGCITKEKFIAGRTAAEIERILGFHPGRLAGGLTVVALLELPATSQFDLAAYSNIATHRFQMPSGLDIEKLKAAAWASWATTGFERLVKVLPATRHDNNLDPDFQYPPGLGAPQWVAKGQLRGKVVGIVTDYPAGRYVAADLGKRSNNSK